MSKRISRRNSRSKRVKSKSLRRKTSRRKSLRRKSLRKRYLKRTSKRFKGGSGVKSCVENPEDSPLECTTKEPDEEEMTSLGYTLAIASTINKENLLPCFKYEKDGFVLDCKMPDIDNKYYIYYKANYDYEGKNEDEINLSNDDYVLVHKRNHFEGGWWYGINLTEFIFRQSETSKEQNSSIGDQHGVEVIEPNEIEFGWFPSNHVEYNPEVNSYDTYATELGKKAGVASPIFADIPLPPSKFANTPSTSPKPPTITPRKESLKQFTAINNVRKKDLGTLFKRRNAPRRNAPRRPAPRRHAPRLPAPRQSTSTSTLTPPIIPPRTKSLQHSTVKKSLVKEDLNNLTETLSKPNIVTQLAPYNGKLAHGSGK